MTSADLPDVVDVRRVALHPGDVVVARTAGPYITAEQAHSIRDLLRQTFPGHEVLVLGPGVDIDVVEPKAAS